MLGTVVYVPYTGMTKIKALHSWIPGCNDRDRQDHIQIHMEYHITERDRAQQEAQRLLKW